MKDQNIKKVLLLGSGALKIGEAAASAPGGPGDGRG